MSKRDIINEINQKIVRSTSPYYNNQGQLSELRYSFGKIELEGEAKSTIISLYVIGIAASIEVAVRAVIKDFINYGPPFLEKIENYKDHLKLDTNILKSLISNEITAGDLVSHLLPISNIDQITSHLSILFSDKNKQTSLQNILSEIKEYIPSDEMYYDNTLDPKLIPRGDNIVPDANNLLWEIKNIFDARHIAAHEAHFSKVSEIEILNFFKTAEIFLKALSEITEQTLHPYRPRDSQGQSLVSMMEAGKEQQQVLNLEYEIENKLLKTKIEQEKKIALFEESKKQFYHYFHHELEMQFSFFGTIISGNAMRNIEARTTEAIFRSRKIYLKETLEWISDEN